MKCNWTEGGWLWPPYGQAGVDGLELEISEIEGGGESRISPKFPIFEMEGVAGRLGLGAEGGEIVGRE